MRGQISSLNYLRTFAVCAEFLSFKLAAKQLNISPTAVSHQIKALESQLRVALFERHTRAISLTLEGEKLAQVCRTSFNAISHVLDDIQQQKNELTVSCCHSFAALWLTPKTADISQCLADSQLKIAASDSLVDLNRDKHIDLAIRYGEPANNSDEVFLYQEQMSVYTSEHYQVEKGKKPVLFVTQWQQNGLLKNLNWQAHIDETQFEIRTFEQEYFVLQAVMTGQGLGLLSDVLATTSLNQDWISPSDKVKAFAGYHYYLRVNPQRKHVAKVQHLVAWFKQCFNQM
ncbi:LysR family transcriptional regulator [Catenovulum sp. SM1970]|uniref:LysR family transcriptional regulator n=1 Tax=Marinifaba aquimaris TaxID=2741323 RepID=UPI001571FA58|nr:LysR family transcriptional regulator [Marinifaba aquimaris]NTS78193.1 LysR family transcriptional regulator [Marinifaba aquimaris]